MRTGEGANPGSRIVTENHLGTNAALLLASLCAVWGLGQVAGKVSISGYSPVFAVGFRSGMGLVLIYGWCWLRGIPLFGKDKSLIPGIIAGSFFAGEFILLYYAFDHTSVARATIFLFTMPFFVAAGAHVLLPDERLTTLSTIGLVIAFIGVVIAFSDRLSLPEPDAWIGDVLAVTAGAFWAATTLAIKASNLRFVAAEKTLAYQLAVSALVFLPIAPFIGPILREPTWWSTAGLFYQALFVTGSTYLVWFWMVRRYPASILSTFLFLVPVFGLTFGAILLDEPITVRLLIALGCIAVGIALVNRQSE